MQDTPKHIGRFPILSTLGVGGMGVVYLGRDPDIGRKVAIKVLHTVGDPVTLDRFKNEAKTVGELTHPNIVTLLEYGVEDSQPFLVMEYLPGESLEEWKNKPHLLFEHKKVLMGLSEALAYAHEKGVLHRDLKPGNVQILPGGHAKLLDFGIARSGDTGLTATGYFIGTPKYLAPELLTGDEHTVASDCYSLALIAYSTLCGQNPFDAGQFEAVMTKKLTVVPLPLHQVNPAIPLPLSNTIAAYLQQNPADRPKGVKALHEALEKLSGDKLLNQRIVPLAEENKDVVAGTTLLQVSGPHRSGFRAWPLAIVSGMILAGGVAGLWLYQQDRHEPVVATVEHKSPAGADVAPGLGEVALQKSGVPDAAKKTPETRLEDPLEPGQNPPQSSEPESGQHGLGGYQEAAVDPGKETPDRKTAQDTPPLPTRHQQPVNHKPDSAPKAKQPVAQNDSRPRQKPGIIGQPINSQQADSQRVTASPASSHDTRIESIGEGDFGSVSGKPSTATKRPVLPSFGDEDLARFSLKPLTSTFLPRGKASKLTLQLPEKVKIDDLKVFRGRSPTRQVSIVKQRSLPGNRLEVSFYVEPNAMLGEYALTAWQNGKKTKPVMLEVTL